MFSIFARLASLGVNGRPRREFRQPFHRPREHTPQDQFLPPHDHDHTDLIEELAKETPSGLNLVVGTQARLRALTRNDPLRFRSHLLAQPCCEFLQFRLSKFRRAELVHTTRQT